MQKNIFENFRLLRNDMRSKEIAVTLFPFEYKKEKYFVVVGLLTEYEKQQDKLRYALLHIQFVDSTDITRTFDTYANTVGFFPKAKIYELRKFLKVSYQQSFNDWEDGFLQYFAKRIPTVISPKLTEAESLVVTRSIASFSGCNPNRIYPFDVRNNGKTSDGKGKERTAYNAQLASVCCPNLYKIFKPYRTYSFYFSDNPEKQKSEEEILANFKARSNNRLF